ncbi:ATP-binding protein [Desulfobacula sp.]
MKKKLHIDNLSKRESKNSENIFRSFVEQSFVGVYIIQNKVFVYVNPKFADLFGYTVEECLNNMSWLKIVHPDDQELVKKQVQKRASGEKKHSNYRFKGIKKNGEIIHVEIYGFSLLYRGCIAVAGTMLDVTETKLAKDINKALFDIANAVNTVPKHQDLYRSIHTFLGRVMDVTNFFIAILDIKERTMYYPYHVDTRDSDFSPITNYDTNKTLTGLVALKRRPVLLRKKDLEKRASQNGVRGILPLIWMGAPLIVKDKVIGVVAVQSYLYPNIYSEQDLQMLSVISDQMAIAIDRKHAEEEKIIAQKIAGENERMALVGQMAGQIAHDFNNMLAVIMGNIELLQMDCKDVETKKTLDLIYKETRKGRSLTKNLVAFARDQELQQKFFRINEKIDLVVNILKKDLEGVEIIRENKPGVPELFADPGMIEFAFLNLIQNSIHAVGKVEHPRITIQTYCLDNNICLEIEDNGCGIPKENLKDIFIPSFTLKGNKDIAGSYKTGIKGSGYGISNVKKYIDQHNGSISVRSVFGSGTTFTISLPVIKRESTAE